MRPYRFLPVLTLVVACHDSSPKPNTTLSSSSTGAAGATATSGAICRTDGTLAFSFKATGLDMLEGKTVWALIIAAGGADEVRPVPVRLLGTVTGGAIELTCDHALAGKLGNATPVVVADSDGVPGCSAGDKLLSFSTLFAIEDPLRITLVDDSLRPVQPTPAWVDSRPPVSATADVDICKHINR